MHRENPFLSTKSIGADLRANSFFSPQYSKGSLASTQLKSPPPYMPHIPYQPTSHKLHPSSVPTSSSIYSNTSAIAPSHFASFSRAPALSSTFHQQQKHTENLISKEQQAAKVLGLDSYKYQPSFLSGLHQFESSTDRISPENSYRPDSRDGGRGDNTHASLFRLKAAPLPSFESHEYYPPPTHSRVDKQTLNSFPISEQSFSPHSIIINQAQQPPTQEHFTGKEADSLSGRLEHGARRVNYLSPQQTASESRHEVANPFASNQGSSPVRNGYPDRRPPSSVSQLRNEPSITMGLGHPNRFPGEVSRIESINSYELKNESSGHRERKFERDEPTTVDLLVMAAEMGVEVSEVKKLMRSTGGVGNTIYLKSKSTTYFLQEHTQ